MAHRLTRTAAVASLVAVLGAGCASPVAVAPLSGPPTIAVCAAEPAVVIAGEPVDFIAAVEGEADIASWDFGDGTAAAVLDTTHVYAEPGVYAATLTVANAAGQADCIATVIVDAPYCLDIVELNSVYFGRNSSRIDDGTVDPDTEARLAENLDALLSCPSVVIEVGGVAQERERRPRHLADERAEAVAAYYRSGVARPERIRVAEGTVTSSEQGAGGPDIQTRRADSRVLPPQR